MNINCIYIDSLVQPAIKSKGYGDLHCIAFSFGLMRSNASNRYAASIHESSPIAVQCNVQYLHLYGDG